MTLVRKAGAKLCGKAQQRWRHGTTEVRTHTAQATPVQMPTPGAHGKRNGPLRGPLGDAYLTVVQVGIGRSSARCTVSTFLRMAQGRIWWCSGR